MRSLSLEFHGQPKRYLRWYPYDGLEKTDQPGKYRYTDRDEHGKIKYVQTLEYPKPVAHYKRVL
jgi:hypothetical protein